MKNSLLIISCIIGWSFGELSAQILPPESTAIKVEMVTPVEMQEEPVDENGNLIMPEGEQRVIVLLELVDDQELHKVQLNIQDVSTQSNLINRTYEGAQGENVPYVFEKQGRTVRLDLGSFSLPSQYAYTIILEDRHGQQSPPITNQN